ncbi:MAG: hypothetical protein U9R34_06975 [Nanoarchaeota archaeon]|nr:hypothetical protein [Nanoarchaeota archaeon]
MRITIILNTIKTSLLKFQAPIKSPCSNLDIARVSPQAGQLHSVNMPDVGQLPLKIKGIKKCLNTHLIGKIPKLLVGITLKITRIEDKLKTFA